jgi:excisionase family DNA binding protein
MSTGKEGAAQAPARSIYPIEEVGERLGGLSHGTIYKLIRTGELSSFTVGRRRFVSASALEAFVSAREQR